MSRLVEIKQSILDEDVSYEELVYLQNHLDEVYDSNDILLAQWAGISEKDWNQHNNKRSL